MSDRRNPHKLDAPRGGDTRQALIAAGRLVFARRGFDGASVREITREAGANLGAITYHFGSKRALYEAVLTTGLSPVVERVAEVAGGLGSAIERLGGVVEVFFEYMGANPDLPRLLLQEVAAGKQPPAAVVGILQRNAGLVVGIVREGQEDGTLRQADPLLCALSIVSQPIYMTVVAPLLRKVGGIDLTDPDTRRRTATHVKEFVRQGLSASEEASE